MKFDDLETSEEYMLSLNWDKTDLRQCKEILIDWDNRPESYYKNRSKYDGDRDKNGREHFRNCIKFWEKRLNNET